MQAQWEELESIHNALATQQVCNIQPDVWCRTIQKTLCLESTSGSDLCHTSPAQCHHCHQMTALSAITMMRMVAKESADNVIDKLYLLPLSQPGTDIIQQMLKLLQHPCAFLQYETRRALISVLPCQTHSCDATNELKMEQGVVRDVIQSCIHMVLKYPRYSPLSHEPLQLLCALLSKQTQDSLIIGTYLECVEHHLPALYEHLCKDTERLESLSTATCISSESGSASVSTEYPASELSFIERPKGSQHSTAKEAAELENEGDNLLTHFQTEQTLYLFLRLVLKIVKCVMFMKTDANTNREPVCIDTLCETVLKPLVTYFVPHYERAVSRQYSYLTERQFLDILDHFFNYSDIRMQRAIPTYYQEIAELFVQTFVQRVEQSWMFLCERPFIGGCAGDIKQRQCGKDRSSRSMDPDGDECDDEEFTSPLLILLLAVILKSSAVVIKASEKAETAEACLRVLGTTHQRLHSRFSASTAMSQCDSDGRACEMPQGQFSITAESGRQASHLDWLPQVCGEQDDRWIEALLCLLDIFIGLQSLTKVGDGSAGSLLDVLDPHWLFLQLLHQTCFDSSLLIDWLTSPETCFLTYLTQYLKLLAVDFTPLCEAARVWDESTGLSSETILGGMFCERATVTNSAPSQNENRKVTERQHQNNENTVGLNPVSTLHASPFPNDFVRDESERKKPLETNNFSGSAGIKRADVVSGFHFVPSSGGDSCVSLKPSVGLALLCDYEDDDGEDDSEGDGDTVDDDNCVMVADRCDREVNDSSTEGDVKARCAGFTNNEQTQQQLGSTGAGGPDYTSPLSSLSELDVAEEMKFHAESKLLSPCDVVIPIDNVNSKIMEGVVKGGEATDGLLPCSSVDRVRTLLSEVGRRMERLYKGGLLVYNPKPLVTLIRQCEDSKRKLDERL